MPVVPKTSPGSCPRWRNLRRSIVFSRSGDFGPVSRIWPVLGINFCRRSSGRSMCRGGSENHGTGRIRSPVHAAASAKERSMRTRIRSAEGDTLSSISGNSPARGSIHACPRPAKSNCGRISAEDPRIEIVRSPENAVSSGLISIAFLARGINPAAG